LGSRPEIGWYLENEKSRHPESDSLQSRVQNPACERGGGGWKVRF
jgi:hypothetical protein